MSEDKALLQLDRAQRAAALLNDEAFNEAVESIKRSLIERWLISKDPIERERIWLSVNITEQIRAALITTVNNGNMARRELEDLASGRTKKHFGVV